MKRAKTLTGIILSESFKARQLCGNGCKKMVSQGEYLRGLLASYEGALGDDYAQRIITGKQTIPVALAMHYSDDAQICPQDLYTDIVSYYESDSITYQQKMTLQDNLLRILQTIPVIDQTEIMAEVKNCSTEVYETYMLLAGLLYYAWRTDLAGYTYVAA